MTVGKPVLRPREDPALTDRLALSATVRNGVGEARAWLAERASAHRFMVERIPFAAMDAWSFAADTGNLVHRTGRFFSVQGLDVRADGQHWQQPVIVQPEIGILGILVTELNGVLHCLMQAKMEPGNVNRLQLSPTVQATRSNYTRVHRGHPVRYLEHFIQPASDRVLVDVLQSEFGSWFYRKSNRNMVIEARGEVPEHEDFRWLTLGQLGELLRCDNVVNMDSRTVLACLPYSGADGGSLALHQDAELLSWFTAQRVAHEVRADLIPLRAVRGWHRGADAIEHEQGRYFSVAAVAVEAGNREVTRWTQPLFAPHGLGVTAFLMRRIEGVTHVLVHAQMEGGLIFTIEIGPTVHHTPANYAGGQAPPFLEYVLGADASQIRYECVHSEEGGRFLHAESRYLFIDAGDDVPADPPAGYLWVTPGQLSVLLGYGHNVNMQARTLIACLLGLQDSLDRA
jgi:oxidase EvaA